MYYIFPSINCSTSSFLSRFFLHWASICLCLYLLTYLRFSPAASETRIDFRKIVVMFYTGIEKLVKKVCVRTRAPVQNDVFYWFLIHYNVPLHFKSRLSERVGFEPPGSCRFFLKPIDYPLLLFCTNTCCPPFFRSVAHPGGRSRACVG